MLSSATDIPLLAGGEIRKSNVISIVTPIAKTVTGSVNDEFFPYITTDNQQPPADTPLEGEFSV